MTFQEFKEITYGVDEYQIFICGSWIVGLDTLDSKYMNMTIAESHFDADDYGRITCTVELIRSATHF